MDQNHITTGNLKIINNSNLHKLSSNGPKYHEKLGNAELPEESHVFNLWLDKDSVIVIL